MTGKDFSKELNNWCDIIENNTKIPPEKYDNYKVKRGLRNSDGTGVLAGLTNIGNVHGYITSDDDRIPDDGRLSYRGISVADIVADCEAENRFGYEEVCYLLLFGKLPTDSELNHFCEAIADMRELPFGFREDMIMKSPSPDIMNKLARSVLSLYSYDENPDSTDLYNLIRQSLLLIARAPSMVAYAYQTKRHYYDGESMFIHSPNRDLKSAENFLYMIRPDNKFTDFEAKVLDIALIIHAEHGGGNNSAFTTHVVSSSGSDTYSAIASAVCSLKGHKHGGANARVMAMMEDFKANLTDINDKDQISEHIRKILRKEAYDHTGLVYGMGHAIYTKSDPRAVILKKYAEELAEQTGNMKEFKLFSLVEELTPEIFHEMKGPKAMCANVDMYSGLVYKMLGIPPELYTPIFAISRMVGWCAHRIEEALYGGKIIRPAYKSVSKNREYTTFKERQ